VKIFFAARDVKIKDFVGVRAIAWKIECDKMERFEFVDRNRVKIFWLMTALRSYYGNQALCD